MNMAGFERDAGCLYESSYKKRMKKKQEAVRITLNLQNNQNFSEFFCM